MSTVMMYKDIQGICSNMISTCTFTPIVASSYKRKQSRMYSKNKKTNVDQLIRKNKRIQASIHKRRDNSVWKDNNRRIVLEELVSFLDLLDDVVDILDSEDFDCGEVPDELNDIFNM